MSDESFTVESQSSNSKRIRDEGVETVEAGAINILKLPRNSDPDYTDLIPRYTKQMMLPQIGARGQRILSESSILIVGAGGIGSSVILYLAGAGVGRLDILDFDNVELSNLHRQIIHDTKNIGMNKAHSASIKVAALNPDINCKYIEKKLTHENAMELFDQGYSLIIDCTDNQTSRYIINDACVLLNKPHIHGSAIGMDGQITVFIPGSGPCYRCLYPKLSSVEGCRSCATSGVLGPVPGIMGSLQAVEAIKVLLLIQEQNQIEESLTITGSTPESVPTPVTSSSSSTTTTATSTASSFVSLQPLVGRQLQYDAMNGEFHTFLLPHADPDCNICSPHATIRNMSDSASVLQRCTNTIIPVASTVLEPKQRVGVVEYAKVLRCGRPHILLDVRSIPQFNMASLSPWLPASGRILNYPYVKMIENERNALESLERMRDSMHTEECDIYVICRRGNDSVRATKLLLENKMTNIYNIDGGLAAWSSFVDPNFPTF